MWHETCVYGLHVYAIGPILTQPRPPHLLSNSTVTPPPTPVPRPLLLEVRNVAHDSAAEYRCYRGGYAPALLPWEGQGEGGGGGGEAAVAVGAPM